MSWRTDSGHRVDLVASGPIEGERRHRLRVTRNGEEIGYFDSVAEMFDAVGDCEIYEIPEQPTAGFG